MTDKPAALYVLAPYAYDLIYGPAERDDLASLVNFIAPAQTAEMLRANPGLLADVEIVISGWGCPRMDAAFLAAAPKLHAVFYGAGSIRGWATDAFWERNITVSAAWAANAVPVAEFALGQILLALKHTWYYALETKRLGRRVPASSRVSPGGYGSTVALISLGMIGQHVARLLAPFDVQVIAYDPFVAPEKARELGVEMVSLEEAFARADVVSLHTPWLKETEGLICGAHFAAMKPGATFLNTARGAIVREAEMIEVLRARPDLTALLDVTYPEPPPEGSPLYAMPNVVLTPHIAGSKDAECRRMGRYMVEELRRYLAGEPLEWQISREKAKLLA